MRDKIKGRRLNWAEAGATRFPNFCGIAIVKSGVFENPSFSFSISGIESSVSSLFYSFIIVIQNFPAQV